MFVIYKDSIYPSSVLKQTAEKSRKHLGDLTWFKNRSVVWFGAEEGADKAATLSLT